jgi:hypothetical protein
MSRASAPGSSPDTRLRATRRAWSMRVVSPERAFMDALVSITIAT